MDARARQARDWAVGQLNLRAFDVAPASADASFRRYFRIESGRDSWILMDAPPAQEDSRPFVRVAQLLQQAGLNVPRVLHADLEQGFLLLTDLGHKTYLHELTSENADSLFDDAINALVQMQSRCPSEDLPHYDAELLQRELDLFPDWFVKHHLGTTFTADQRRLWAEVCQRLIESALEQAQVFVHRDFMPRNLMLSTPNPGVLDFQDAVCGPVTYDLVCLFKDAFLSWPEHCVAAWIERYRECATRADIPLPQDFRRALDWMGVQRHLKVLGIFARICHRDGKPHYLADAPRFIRYIGDVAPRYSALSPLVQLFEQLGIQR